MVDYRKLVEIFRGIKDASGNAKKPLLQEALKYGPFIKVCQLILDTSQTFHISKLKEMSDDTIDQDLFEFLAYLDAKGSANAKDKRLLTSIASESAEKFEITNKILRRKTDAGFSASTLNKVCPGLIKVTPYQRCSTDKNLHRVQLPAIIQKKADGIFAYQINGEYISRKGKRISSCTQSVKDHVLCGELTVLEKDGSPMSRKKGNGFLNTLAQGGSILYQVKYDVWDMLTEVEYYNAESKRPYGERWETLKTTAKGVKFITSREVSTLVEAQAFYKQMRKQGEEGAVLKDKSALWKSNTCPTFCKMKHFASAEFVVICMHEGKDKYEGMLGALEVESADGKIRCKVGSGFTDAQRDLSYWEDGKIVEVQFESVITDKRREIKSLFLPTFVKERADKIEADTLEYVESL